MSAPLDVRIVGEYVVDGSAYLVHALHVRVARVELGKYEQYALYDLPVGLLAISQMRVLAAEMVVALARLGLEVGAAEAVLDHVVHVELGVGDTLAQALVAFAVRRARVLDLLARELGGLLEEEDVRTQAPHVLVDLQQHRVVLEVRAPLASRTGIQRLPNSDPISHQEGNKKSVIIIVFIVIYLHDQ